MSQISAADAGAVSAGLGASPGSLGMDLAMAAAMRERANRSRALIILACVALLAAAVYALTGYLARSEAADRVARQAAATQQLQQLAQRFQAATQGQADARFAPDPLMGSKLERLAGSLGLKLSAPVEFVEVPSVGGPPGLVQRKFTARAANADPEVLFQFLVDTQDKTNYPGLDVSAIVLRPSGAATAADATHNGGWDLQVDFTRWERRAG